MSSSEERPIRPGDRVQVWHEVVSVNTNGTVQVSMMPGYSTVRCAPSDIAAVRHAEPAAGDFLRLRDGHHTESPLEVLAVGEHMYFVRVHASGKPNFEGVVDKRLYERAPS